MRFLEGVYRTILCLTASHIVVGRVKKPKRKTNQLTSTNYVTTIAGFKMALSVTVGYRGTTVH